MQIPRHNVTKFVVPTRPLAVLAAVFSLALPLVAADDGIVPEGAKLERVYTGASFTEGPAAGPDGAIYFSDIPNDSPGAILRFDPKTGKTTVFRKPSGKSNGLAFDPAGRLIACEGANRGGRRISVTQPDGTVETLADRYDGRRFNSPNDLCIDRQGRIYLTDPRYVGDEPMELPFQSVYRIDPDGRVHRIIQDVEKPNGIGLSPDFTTLYVVEHNNEPVKEPNGRVRPGTKALYAYPLRPDGTVGARRIVVSYTPRPGLDGICLDTEGNIYAALRDPAEPGIHVYRPSGKRIAWIRTPELPTNCTFGTGSEADVLYITAGGSLYRIRLNARGWHLFDGSSQSQRGGRLRGLLRLRSLVSSDR